MVSNWEADFDLINIISKYLTRGVVSNTCSNIYTAADPWWSVKGLKQIFAEEKLCWPIDLENNGHKLANAV